MIVHTAVVVPSKDSAVSLFENLFGMERLYEFDIPREAFETLFQISTEAHAMVYNAGNTQIEVFIIPGFVRPKHDFSHTCIAVTDRMKVIQAAADLGCDVRQFHRQDATVVFLKDPTGNLFEIKQR